MSPRVSFARRLFGTLSLAPTLLLAASTCLPARPAPDGSCQVEPASAIDCTVATYGTDKIDIGLVPYSCSGSARPDQNSTYVEHIPQGTLCADKGTLGDTGRTAYCCSTRVDNCVYNPVSDCDDPLFGVQCRSGYRPETMNPALSCTNGYLEGKFRNYCCSGNRPPSPCLQSDTLGCPPSIQGYSCQDEALPSGEDLGANESRADFFHPTCSIPKIAPNPKFKNYCCFMPALVPKGGTCTTHPSLEGCAPGRYAFACYGPDTPEQDNYPMKCDPGVAGKSAEGYPATTYCCDYILANAIQ